MKAALAVAALVAAAAAAGCGGSAKEPHGSGLVSTVRTALVDGLEAKHLTYRWVACLRNGRSFQRRPVVRCNVNFGDPHVEAYCGVLVRGRLRTDHDDAAIPCTRDRAGWKVLITSS